MLGHDIYKCRHTHTHTHHTETHTHTDERDEVVNQHSPSRAEKTCAQRADIDTRWRTRCNNRSTKEVSQYMLCMYVHTKMLQYMIRGVTVNGHSEWMYVGACILNHSFPSTTRPHYECTYLQSHRTTDTYPHCFFLVDRLEMVTVF